MNDREEYEERMGGPEMEYLQYLTDFPQEKEPRTEIVGEETEPYALVVDTTKKSRTVKEMKWNCAKFGEQVDTSTDGLLTNTHSHKEEEPQWRKIGESEYTEHWSLDGHSYIELGKKLKEHLLASERADWLRSEIEKLEGMATDQVNPAMNKWFNQGIMAGMKRTLTSIITRYKEELLELEKGV